MTKPRKQREYNPLSSISGVMECQQEHRWAVRDLNPERINVNCPVCGGLTSIKEGMTYDGPER